MCVGSDLHQWLCTPSPSFTCPGCLPHELLCSLDVQCALAYLGPHRIPGEGSLTLLLHNMTVSTPEELRENLSPSLTVIMQSSPSNGHPG